VQGLAGFKVGLSNAAPTLGSEVAAGSYTDCGDEYGDSLPNTDSVTIAVNCATVGQPFRYVIILGSRTFNSELCMEEVEVYDRCEYCTFRLHAPFLLSYSVFILFFLIFRFWAVR